MSILIIPLDKQSQFTYKNSDNIYIDHPIISLFKFEDVKDNYDEFFKKATDQIPFYKSQIDKEKSIKLQEDAKLDKKLQDQIDVEEKKIKSCNNGIEKEETEIENLKVVKQKFDEEIKKLNDNIKILKEEKGIYEAEKGTKDTKKIAELILNIQIDNQKITDIKKHDTNYFNNQNNIDNCHTRIRILDQKIDEYDKKIKSLELQKNNKEKLILRLTFEFNIFSNKLLGYEKFTPK